MCHLPVFGDDRSIRKGVEQEIVPRIEYPSTQFQIPTAT